MIGGKNIGQIIVDKLDGAMNNGPDQISDALIYNFDKIFLTESLETSIKDWFVSAGRKTQVIVFAFLRLNDQKDGVE
jgi:hypothetical protein